MFRDGWFAGMRYGVEQPVRPKPLVNRPAHRQNKEIRTDTHVGVALIPKVKPVCVAGSSSHEVGGLRELISQATVNRRSNYV